MRTIATMFLFIAALPLLADDDFNGVVRPAEQVIVTTPAAGIVEQILVQRGDHVKKGDVLARVDATTLRVRLEQAEAKLRVAEVALNAAKVDNTRQARAELEAELALKTAEWTLAKANLGRTEQLVKAKVIADREFAELQHEERVARAAVEQAQARHDTLGEQDPHQAAIAEAELNLARTQVEAARLELDRTILRSPIDGRILKHNLQVGALAEPAALAITVANVEQLVVVALFPEAKLHQLEKGLKCKVATSAGELDGAIREIAPLIEDGQIECVIDLDHGDVELLPGMRATVRFEMPDAVE